MKSIHFCTPRKLEEVHENKEFLSIRTGYIPSFFPGDVIKINHRNFSGIDLFLYQGKVISVIPVLFRDLDKDNHKEEIERYHRKFNPDQWFFIIKIRKMKTK